VRVAEEKLQERRTALATPEALGPITENLHADTEGK
jgi:hypothetical protein